MTTLATPPQPPTRTGLLSEARHVVLPAGIASSAWPSVRETCRKIGIEFDPWQVDLNRAILGKSLSGLYAADTVEISIPRQVGKTFDVGALVFADSIINPGTTTVWTAHRFKVARETFNELRALAKSAPLAPHIEFDDITTAAGNETIPFRNGSRIVFAARERGAIRGFTKVRRLVLDEGQILTEAAMADLAPTMNQAANPQIILMGTPPKPTDPSEVFSRLRAEALAGQAEGVLYVEFSAPPSSDLDDRQAWQAANPSYPKRTPSKAILRMRKLLSDEDFRREAMGVWDEVDASKQPVTSVAWGARATADGPLEDERPTALGLDRWYDGSTSIAAAWRRDDSTHVELVASQVTDSPTGIVDWLVQRAGRRIPVVIAADSPAAAVAPDLRARHVKVMLLSTAEYGRACVGFVDDVGHELLTHPPAEAPGQERMDAAVAAATRRDIGSAGAWGWDRRSLDKDISPLVAATLARLGAVVNQRKKASPSSGKVVVLS